jgi:hypothetical protein
MIDATSEELLTLARAAPPTSTGAAAADELLGRPRF